MNLKDETQALVNEYLEWLRDKTSLKLVNEDWVEITTPFLDRHNDCLQVYLKKEEHGFLLTDDGFVIDDLTNCGCDLKTQKRNEILLNTLRGFGVQFDESTRQLFIHCSAEDFPLKKHSLLQAMLAINDLFYLATPSIKHIFYEDVLHWLDKFNVRFISKVKFEGRSGFNHMFDFVIPKSSQAPERFVQTLNNPSKQSAGEVVFKWLDTHETRSSESKLLVLLNDSSNPVKENIISAFEEYSLKTVLWSEREKSSELFVA